MNIIITQWALDAYLELKNMNVFSDSYYQEKLRPDALLLKTTLLIPGFRMESSGHKPP